MNSMNMIGSSYRRWESIQDSLKTTYCAVKMTKVKAESSERILTARDNRSPQYQACTRSRLLLHHQYKGRGHSYNLQPNGSVHHLLRNHLCQIHPKSWRNEPMVMNQFDELQQPYSFLLRPCFQLILSKRRWWLL